MSILPDTTTIEQIKAAGGNCMSISTAEYYYEIYLQYLIRKNRRSKMDAYRVTAEELFKSEKVIIKAVKFGTQLTKIQ